MPATTHPVFVPPDDPNAKIWRYMDFTKFVSMLENGGLFFCRADKLGDRFEGSYPKSQLAIRAEMESRFPEFSKQDWSNTEEINRFYTKWTMLSCWHMNSHESAAMWKIYTMTKESIAIRSTFAKLRDKLDEKYFIGEVKYMDYENDVMPQGNMLFPFVHKRLSFAHEREVRALTQQLPPEIMNHAYRSDGHWSIADSLVQPPDGIWKVMNLVELIDAVFVAPDAPSWFKELVGQVLGRYSFQIAVTQSSLDDDPLY